MTLYGIDVSHWRGEVDWPRVHQAGIVFAFAKVTEGTSYIDPRWTRNRDGMTKLGGFLPGGYHFLRGDVDIKQQVKHFLAKAGDVSGLAVALDVETRVGAARQATRAQAQEWVAEFKRLTGGHPVIGYYPHWYWDQTNRGDLLFFDTLWASHYVSGAGGPTELYRKVHADWWSPYGGEPVSILQFSASGTVPGVPPPVDLNAYRGTLSELRETALGGRMAYLKKLAEVARRTGYPVTEVPGWQTRGHGPQPAVLGVVCHHTAGPVAGGDYPSLNVVRSGRPGLEGPLSHFGLGRSGRIYVIAAGRCWHNAPSTSVYHTNSNSIGIEAENNGRQAWPAQQLDAYRKLCAELCREFRFSPSRVKGHKEVNTQKPDPHSVNMNDFRIDVARLLSGAEEDDMPKRVSVGTTKPLPVPPNEWVTIPWDKSYSDPDNQHGGEGLSVLTGKADYNLGAGLTLAGLPAGAKVLGRVVEVKPDPDQPDPVVTAGPVSDVTSAGDATYLNVSSIADVVDQGNKVRVQVRHNSIGPATVEAGAICKVQYWR